MLSCRAFERAAASNFEQAAEAVPKGLATEVAERLSLAGCVAAAEEAGEMLAGTRDRAVLERWIARRERGEPLAWITGRVIFCGVALHVDPGLYVPRFQTEELARRAAGLLPAGGRAADACTGTGAIAAYLACTHRSASVVATDLDPRAAHCARRNGVRALVADLGWGLRPGVFDVVTAVTPYVPTGELRLLPADVLRYEPLRALVGGADGLDVVRRLVHGAVRLLKPGGWLLTEIGGDQDRAVEPLLERAGFAEPELWYDDEGDLRGVAARIRQAPVRHCASRPMPPVEHERTHMPPTTSPIAPPMAPPVAPPMAPPVDPPIDPPVAPPVAPRATAPPRSHVVPVASPRIFRVVKSPIGELTLAGDGEVLTHLAMQTQAHPPVGRASWRQGTNAFGRVVHELEAYFAGDLREFSIELRPEGSRFQEEVWAALLEIGYGETRSYGEVAAAIGRPGAQRAVGLANARNPIAIIVPCHRVIGASGALTGYGGGLERKQALLDLEARHRPDPGLRGLGHELDPGAGQLSSAAPSMP